MSTQNCEKLTSLVRKMSALAHPLLSVRTHHKFRNPDFLYQKLRKSASEEYLILCLKNVRTRQTPFPLTADVLYEQPLKMLG